MTARVSSSFARILRFRATVKESEISRRSRIIFLLSPCVNDETITRSASGRRCLLLYELTALLAFPILLLLWPIRVILGVGAHARAAQFVMRGMHQGVEPAFLQFWAGVRMRMTVDEDTGEDLDPVETTLFICNHQRMSDVFLFPWAGYGKLESAAIVNVQWRAMLQLGLPSAVCDLLSGQVVFVDAHLPEAHALEKRLHCLGRDKPFRHAAFFPEGALFTDRLHERSVKWAQDTGLADRAALPQHALVPRMGNFLVFLDKMPKDCTVVSCTLGYTSEQLKDKRTGSLLELLSPSWGKQPYHAHIRKFKLSDARDDPDAWLTNLFAGNDGLLEHFEREGAFPGREVAPAQHSPLRVASRLLQYTFAVWLGFKVVSVAISGIA
jgi:hypothetical protein